MKIGCFLSSGRMGTRRPDRAGRQQAQRAGFEGLWISDHYHPWNDAQGHSGFVWGTIGAIAQAAPGMPVTTTVTCPTMRCQAGRDRAGRLADETSEVLLDGRCAFGVGSGEALNDHIFGNARPNADVRLEMLEESIEVIRRLWEGGVRSRSHRYRVEHARVYDLPADAAADRGLGIRPEGDRAGGPDRGRVPRPSRPDADAVGRSSAPPAATESWSRAGSRSAGARTSPPRSNT